MLIDGWSHYGNTLQKDQQYHADDVFDVMLTLADVLMPITQGVKSKKKELLKPTNASTVTSPTNRNPSFVSSVSMC